jgi:hypothetical protein
VSATITLPIPTMMPTISNSFSPGLIPMPRRIVWWTDAGNRVHNSRQVGASRKSPVQNNVRGDTVNRESERLLAPNPTN